MAEETTSFQKNCHKARLKPNKENIYPRIPYLASRVDVTSRGFGHLHPSGLAGCSPNGLSLGQVSLGVCKFPWQMFQISGICNFLEPHVNFWIYFHSFTLSHFRGHIAWPPRPPLKQAEAFMTPWLLHSGYLKQPAFHEWCLISCQLDQSQAFLDHVYSSL